MPVPEGTRYRMTKDGVRLAFAPGGAVIEAKNMETGATHTAAEFKADARRKKKRGMSDKEMSDHMNRMIRGGR